MCSQCNRGYHVDSPPETDWVCDHCGALVVQRDDDTEEAVLRRLELYEVETLPVIQYYRRVGTLAHVDGSWESDDVFKRLVEAVEARLDPRAP